METGEYPVSILYPEVYMNNKELVSMALKAREYSYSPYSKFSVGAALLTESGKIYTGCNIENSSFGATNCAERTAFFKAVSEGEHEFKAIAIVGGRHGEEISGYAYPCGICRQVMREFCNPDGFVVLVAKNEEDIKEYTLKELLPESFGPENL